MLQTLPVYIRLLWKWLTVICTTSYGPYQRVIGWKLLMVTRTTVNSTDHRVIGWIWVMVTHTTAYSTNHRIIGSIIHQHKKVTVVYN